MSGNDSQRATLATHLPLAAATSGLASLIDVLVGADALGPSILVSALGLGIAGGLLLGLVLVGVLVGARRLPRWGQRLAWGSAGAALAISLITSLGVLARLDGDDRLEAIAAALAAAGAGALLAALGLAAQPARDAPAWIDRLAPRRAAWLAAALTMLAAALIAADRMIGVGSYDLAHNALRAMALLVLALVPRALLGARPARRDAPRRLRRGLALLASGAVAWALLAPGSSRETFAELLARPLAATPLRALRIAGDFDLDGYTAILGGGDCAPFDPTIHPFAADVPGNGVDENCRLGDASITAPIDHDPPVPTEPAPISVVLITIDSVRADHTSWGGQRDTTPKIAEWARDDATIFRRAYTTGTWTSLALPSLMHGVYPRRLTWVAYLETNRLRLLRRTQLGELRARERPRLMFGLPNHDPHVPLSTLLRRRGVYTMAVIDDGRTGFLDASTGAYPDFDKYIEVSGRPVDRAVSDAAIKLLRSRPKGRPFFLWAHYFGPHVPDRRHKSAPDFGPGVADKYDHEIAYTDLQIRRVLDELDKQRKKQPIAVIITSDHGETIGRRRNHGVNVGEGDLQVPLVVSGPGLVPGESDVVVSAVDIMPTILAWTRTPAPGGLDGLDLARIAADPTLAAGRILLAETWRFNAAGEPTHDMVAAFDGELKLVCDLLDEGLVVRTQPRERHRPYTTPGVERLQAALDAYLEVTGPPRFVD